MEVPGPLFSLSVGCFGKQDCQICSKRRGAGGGGGVGGGSKSMVWLMTLIGLKGSSEFIRSQRVP